MKLGEWLSGRVFRFVHNNNLVYNTCWEDPRLDRVALEINDSDNILVITSAGCNALDYALLSPRHVHAVDMNPRQNALLELKLAGIKRLEFEDFFKMFGEGRLPGARAIYKDVLRQHLCERSQQYWDRRIGFFDNRSRPFYYRGTSGSFARFIKIYTKRVIGVHPYLEAAFEAESVDEQREIYERDIKERFWTRMIRFAMNRDATLSMLGVPRAQRRQIDTQYPGGIVQFVEDCVESVFAKLPLKDNYFWRVYVMGQYTSDCCPEYLKPDNFQALKQGLGDRITAHTQSVQGFLERFDGEISKFVLLDHMDWLSDHYFDLLVAEWQAILARATPNARLIWRSGGLRTDFLDRVQLDVRGQQRDLQSLLTYHKELAEELHAKDRVHTYGSFYIADLAA